MDHSDYVRMEWIAAYLEGGGDVAIKLSTLPRGGVSVALMDAQNERTLAAAATVRDAIDTAIEATS